MRIALFGGSFDPPHVAHQMVCLYALATQEIDQVWMVPCYRHPFDKRSAPFAHRAAMCRLAAAPMGTGVQVCTLEEEIGGPSYTLVTLKAVMARHPEHEFCLLIGGDLVRERERWYGWQELSQIGRFIVVGRTGAENSGEIDLPPVSSTYVRAELAQGRMPQALVPRTVLAYIQEHELYGATQSER